MTEGTKLKRYLRVYELVKNSYQPTLPFLVDEITSEGFDFSERTLQRDLKVLRDEFFIDIQYDRATSRYKIVECDEEYLEKLVHFFKLSYQAESFTQSLRKNKKIFQNISYDYENLIKGTEYFPDVLQAINGQKVVQFNHYSFNEFRTKIQTVEPYFLKEFQGRWYLLGRLISKEPGDGFRSFCFDRIDNLIVLKQKFKSQIKNPKQFYQEVVGISGWNKQIETIVLSFTKLQGQYAKNLPIHESQVIVKETEDEVIVRLRIKPNFEFYQQMLGLGASVKVLSPDNVKQELKNKMELALKNYQ